MGEPVLEVRVLHRADAEAAAAGGADRLMVVALGEVRAHAPDPGMVAEVVRSSGLPVRPLLRLPADADRPDTTTGAGLDRMVGLAGEYVAAGADGVVAGFTTDQLEIDVELATALGEQLNCSWTFSRALDRTLEHRRSWRHVLGLPGVDAVLSAGSSVDAEHGHQQLLELAADPAIAARLVAAGGVRPEHVPWLLRAKVAGVQVASAVRPGGSWTKAHVDTQLVRSWRLLLDDELAARRSRS